MFSIAIDLTGRTFGRLKVTGRTENDIQGKASWNCLCGCGSTIKARGYHLRRGSVRSCGCLMKESVKARSTRHGGCGHPLFGSWQNMHTRCYNVRHPQFNDYGGRGIQVCVRWHKSEYIGFKNFCEDMGDKPSAKHSIDRVNNDWGYMPSNCRWATRSEQRYNSRPKS